MAEFTVYLGIFQTLHTYIIFYSTTTTTPAQSGNSPQHSLQNCLHSSLTPAPHPKNTKHGPLQSPLSNRPPLNSRDKASPHAGTNYPGPTHEQTPIHHKGQISAAKVHKGISKTPPSLPATPCRAYKILLRMSSSFFSTSPGVRSSSAAIDCCLSAGSAENCSQRSPSIVSFTGK